MSTQTDTGVAESDRDGRLARIEAQLARIEEKITRFESAAAGFMGGPAIAKMFKAIKG